MEEIWRPMKGGEGRYLISNTGKIKGRGGNLLHPYTLNHKGYQRVSVIVEGVRKQMMVHRLVAEAFPDICGEMFDGCTVDHINTITNDNRAQNLRVCTLKENIHNPLSIRHYSVGNTKKTAKKIVQLGLDGSFVKIWLSLSDAEKIGYKHSSVSGCLTGKRHTAYGYKWEYIND